MPLSSIGALVVDRTAFMAPMLRSWIGLVFTALVEITAANPVIRLYESPLIPKQGR